MRIYPPNPTERGDISRKIPFFMLQHLSHWLLKRNLSPLNHLQNLSVWNLTELTEITSRISSTDTRANVGSVPERKRERSQI
jgi:hypothetical protein